MARTTAAALAGRDVGRVGLGTMQLEPHGGDTGALTSVLHQAVELGVRHLDTAEFYGGGAVNALIRDALHPYDGLTLVSKVGATWAGGRLVPAQQPAQLRAEVEANLRTLNTDRLAVVNLRRVDTPPGLVATGDQVVALDDQLAELVALRDEGMIGAIGLSAVSLPQLEQALPVGIACVQNAYNLLERQAQPLLEACARHDVAFVPFFPLGSGFPGRRRVADDPRVTAAAARLQVTPAQVGLAWLLAQDAHVLLIPGTRSVEHLRQNVAAAHLVLDAAARAALA